ncbi:hypothetical protein [Streptosporangium longisporum]|uniref:Uncharacterized protein n=1 Tax=Streptosporangium longisporum TaxID=46187 RepID=A0ABP6LA58_9ACTN
MHEPVHHEITDADTLAEPTPTRWTATQVFDMATHIRTCRVCGDGGQDPEISAGLTEEWPVEEMADFIASGHHPAWLAMLAEGRAERERSL